VLGTGGTQERVSRVGLTAADLGGARRREPAPVTRLYSAYAPVLLRSRSFDPARLTRQGEPG
jgi:hypothetical protein